MMTLINERNRDFMKKCQEINTNWRGNRQPTRLDIISLALSAKAPGYYVSYEHAYRNILKYHNGKLPRNTTPVKLQMWDEISSKIGICRARWPDMSLPEALAMVLTTHASRFFISKSYAQRLYYHLNNPYESHKKNSPCPDYKPDCDILLDQPTDDTHSRFHIIERQFPSVNLHSMAQVGHQRQPDSQTD